MSIPRGVLIVYHSRTGFCRQLSQFVEQGARTVLNDLMQNDEEVRKMVMSCGNSHFDSSNVNVNDFIRRCRASDVKSFEEIRSRSGYVFCAPENLASLSGEMKEFFD